MADSGLKPMLGWDQIQTGRQRMLDEFDRARKQAKAHEVETYHGNVAETEVKKWLTEFLPKRYGVTSGYIISSGLTAEDKAPRFDVIIYDQMNSPVLWVEEHSGSGTHGRSLAIPVEYVCCVLEVKARFSLRDVKKAVEQLGDLKPLLQREESDGLRYRQYLSKRFVCGAIFFQLGTADLTSDTALDALVEGAKIRGFIGGIILRSDTLPPNVSGKIDILWGDSAREEVSHPGGTLAGTRLSKTILHENIHLGTFLRWSDREFTQFGFDLIAMMQGTYDGRVSSFYALGVSSGELSSSSRNQNPNDG